MLSRRRVNFCKLLQNQRMLRESRETATSAATACPLMMLTRNNIPGNPKRTESMNRRGPLNSNNLGSSRANGLSDYPSFFASRGRTTIDNVLGGNFSGETRSYDEARDIVGIIRVKLASLLTQSHDALQSTGNTGNELSMS